MTDPSSERASGGDLLLIPRSRSSLSPETPVEFAITFDLRQNPKMVHALLLEPPGLPRRDVTLAWAGGSQLGRKAG
jgi:hypothetical protein